MEAIKLKLKLKLDSDIRQIKWRQTTKRWIETVTATKTRANTRVKYRQGWGFLPGGGVLGSIFAGYVPLASPNLYPIIVYSVANYRLHVSHFWANIPQIPTCRNLLTPEIPQISDPILVTLLAPIETATPL